MFISREHRTTAARVCDDRRAGVECSDVSFCEFARAVEIAGMRVQRAATNLVLRPANVKAIGAQNARGCTVDTIEQPFAHATREQQYGGGLGFRLHRAVNKFSSSGEYWPGTLEQSQRKFSAAREEARQSRLNQKARQAEVAE